MHNIIKGKAYSWGNEGIALLSDFWGATTPPPSEFKEKGKKEEKTGKIKSGIGKSKNFFQN